MTTATCTRCPQQARWRDADGRQFCGSHVPANGKPLARLPAPEVPDIVDRLEDCVRGTWIEVTAEVLFDAVAEIRRLRALLEAAGDKSGAC
jgi:hypothetical protein